MQGIQESEKSDRKKAKAAGLFLGFIKAVHDPPHPTEDSFTVGSRPENPVAASASSKFQGGFHDIGWHVVDHPTARLLQQQSVA